MAKSYWIVNSNRSEVRRFIKNTDNKDQFFQYIFVDYGKIFGVFGKEAPVMERRTELKIDAAREEYKNYYRRVGARLNQFGLFLIEI